MPAQRQVSDSFTTEHLHTDLKGRSVRGGLLTLSFQGTQFLVRSVERARIILAATEGLGRLWSNRLLSVFFSSETKIPRPAEPCWVGMGLLALTAAISLTWSSCKLLWWDEFLAFWTDAHANLSRLVEIQRNYPISLDPLVNHWMASVAMRIFGANAVALRLPSLLGFLMMQVCLFCFVRRIATSRAAVVAMALPALTTALYFSVEGRPYGMMLGLCALLMVCWQAATRRERTRTPALISLAVALALLLNTHYAGVLLLAPIIMAELVRTIQRRRFDFPVAAAIAAGTAGIAFAVPFMEAASEFRANYSTATPVSPRQIASTFRENITTRIHSIHGQFFFFIVSLAVAVVVLCVCLRQVREKSISLPSAEVAFLSALVALPLPGYLFAVFVTHDFESRYVLCSVIGVSVLLAIGVNPLLRYRLVGNMLLVFLFAAVAVVGVMHVIVVRKVTRETIATLELSPQVKAPLLAGPSRKLYFQNPGEFAQASYYEPDPQVRSRMVLVYSKDREMSWNHRDTIYITAQHLRRFTQLPMADFESVRAEPGEQFFTIYKDPPGEWAGHGWNWTDQVFASSHAQVTPIGPGFGGEVVSVRFYP